MSVSATDVQKIYPDSVGIDISGFLATAQVITDVKLLGKGLDTTLLDQITIYLAAHFAVIGLEHGGLRRERLGDGDESYKVPGDFDLGFKSTRFGQQAMIMDSTGTLAGMGTNSGLRALLTVVGTGAPTHRLWEGLYW